MSDVTGSGIDWNGPITIIITGLVSILVEYFRRKMPPERHDRRAEDKFSTSTKSPGYEGVNEDDQERELEDDDV